MKDITLRERFEKELPRKRWVTTLTIGGIHQLQEDTFSLIESEIANARKEMKEECLKCIPEKRSKSDDQFIEGIEYAKMTIRKSVQSLN